MTERTVEIELDTLEAVVPGGVRRVTWLVAMDDDWTLVSELPNARVEQRDTGPGVVWHRQVAVVLPIGARLMRVESVPRRAPPQDPLAYLLGSGAKSGRETRRSQFVVAPSGALQRLPPPNVNAPKPRAR